MCSLLHLIELVQGDDVRRQMSMNIKPNELAVPVHGRQELRALIFSFIGPPDVPMKASANSDLRQSGEQFVESRHLEIVPQASCVRQQGQRAERLANPAVATDGWCRR